MIAGKIRCWAFASLLVIGGGSICFSETTSMRVQYEGGPLEYRISLTKDTFYLYEPIFAEIWVTNINPYEVKVRIPTVWLGWVIKDQTGKLYRSPVSPMLAVPKELSFEPGDSVGGRVDLRGYGIDSFPYPYGVFPTGSYSVAYRAGEKSTDFLSFSVIEPTGKEAEALKLYSEALTSTLKFKPTPKQKYIEQVQRLKLVADRYPNSAYAPAALENASGVAWNALFDGELYRGIVMRQLREFSDPFLNGVRSLEFYYRRIKGDMNGFRTELDSIIRTTNNPRLSAMARSALKKLEKKR